MGGPPRAALMSIPPFQLQQIDHVVLRVRDIVAMQAFYCDVLGCREERRQDETVSIEFRDDQGPRDAPSG